MDFNDYLPLFGLGWIGWLVMQGVWGWHLYKVINSRQIDRASRLRDCRKNIILGLVTTVVLLAPTIIAIYLINHAEVPQIEAVPMTDEQLNKAGSEYIFILFVVTTPFFFGFLTLLGTLASSIMIGAEKFRVKMEMPQLEDELDTL